MKPGDLVHLYDHELDDRTKRVARSRFTVGDPHNRFFGFDVAPGSLALITEVIHDKGVVKVIILERQGWVYLTDCEFPKEMVNEAR